MYYPVRTLFYSTIFLIICTCRTLFYSTIFSIICTCRTLNSYSISNYALIYIILYNYHLLFSLPNNNIVNIICETQILKKQTIHFFFFPVFSSFFLFPYIFFFLSFPLSLSFFLYPSSSFFFFSLLLLLVLPPPPVATVHVLVQCGQWHGAPVK
jgi:hypothetical protein